MTVATSTTVAVPMHRSAPFIDVISANIAALPDDVEIILSDRTREDDAIERLRRRHGGDPRIRCIQGADGFGIVDHYNSLLRAAHGEYFMWMPHDDTFPADYVPLLRGALDDRRDAILAFGSIRPIDLDGRLLPDMLSRPLPIDLGRLSRADEAICLRHDWNISIPFRGLMRRRAVLHHRLFLQHGLREQWHDFTWVFAMTVAAPIVSVPECVCEKRYHEGSHHAPWSDRRAVDELAEIVIVGRYLAAARVPWPDAAKAMSSTTRRAVQRASWHLPERVRSAVPPGVRRAARRLVTPK